PHRLRLQAGLLEDQGADGDHLRRRRPARLARLDARRLPFGEERVPVVAAGEGQQPHRADDGARYWADLLRHQEPRRVPADAPQPRPVVAANPMSRVVLVMGVAGAGKTTVGQRLAIEIKARFEDADAYHPSANVAKMRRGLPLDEADREPWIAALQAKIRGW